MYKEISASPFRRLKFRRASGIALVVILFCVTLLAMMVLAFISGARTELASSTQYSNSSQSQLLAASALNVAMGQLTQATDLSQASDPTTVAWASQPGMIRTYDNSGNPLKFYKLYSSDHMIVDGGAFDAAQEGLQLKTWNTQPALYTDLNEPAVRMLNGAATPYFPIVDPRAAGKDANNQPILSGFSYDSTAIPGAISPSSAVEAAKDTAARLPMPTEWLYVLKDGSLHAASSTNGTTAKVAGASKANPIIGRVAFWTDDDSCKVNINTASEGSYWEPPVVLYMWDWLNLDYNWPLAGEFQRFSGHPSTTSLSVVFPTLKAPAKPSDPNPLIPMVPEERNDKFYDMTPRITQGGSVEGTAVTNASPTPAPLPVSGAPLYDSVDELMYSPYSTPASTPPAPMKPITKVLGRTARSYLTPQDLELRRFFLTAHSRAPETNLFNQPRVAIWPFDNDPALRTGVEKLMALASTAGRNGSAKEFFFTRNAAPTLTAPNPLNPSGAMSPTMDFLDAPRGGRNIQLYTYLQTLTDLNIPGFGGKLDSNWGDDRDQILTEIFDYIRAGLDLRTGVKNGAIVTNGSGSSYTPDISGYHASVYPTVISSGPGAGTRGFGRWPTIAEVALVIGSDYQGPETDKDPTTGLPTNINSPPPAPPVHPMDQSNRYSLTGLKDANGKFVMENDMWPALLVEMFLPSPGIKAPEFPLAVTVDGLNTFTWQYTAKAADGTLYLTSAPMWPVPKKTFSVLANVVSPGMFRGATSRVGVVLLYIPMAGVTWTDPQGSTVTNYGTTAGKDNNNVVVQPSQGPSPGFNFQGGTATITVTPYGIPQDGTVDTSWAQKFTIKFPSFSMTLNPVPAPLVDTVGPPPNPPHVATINDTTMTVRCHLGGTTATNNFIMPNPGWVPGNVTPDIIRSMVVRHGDYRFVLGKSSVLGDGTSSTINDFIPHPSYTATSQIFHAHSLASSAKGYYGGVGQGQGASYTRFYPYSYSTPAPALDYTQPGYLTCNYPLLGSLVPNLPPPSHLQGGYSLANAGNEAPKLPPGASALLEGAFNGKEGDWDNGTGDVPDGSYINKPDEGFDITFSGINTLSYNMSASTNGSNVSQTYEGFYSPSRQIASAVMFGSLSTGIKRNLPWQTLLFCPNPASGWATKTEHPGFGSPADGPPFGIPPEYLLLDLFWMPVTEPWAISDGFSTAGKINLNYRMVPFNYIRRDTGVRAVFANTYMTAISDDMLYDSPNNNPRFLAYKHWLYATPSDNYPSSIRRYVRFPINADETLKQFEEKFDGTGPDGRKPDIFRSAAQICSVFLVPGNDPSGSGGSTLPATRAVNGFWANKRLTGDNMRERPYNAIYPRVTSRSNVYTVHVRAQALQQTLSTLNADPTTFIEGKDKVLGEYRVGYTIERYLDPNLDTYTDGQALGPYKLRVINQRTVDW